MSASRPDLSVVVVSWNVRDHVLRCLEAVTSRAGGLDVEVWLVDNASDDGTVDAVRDRFPGVRVVENDRNLGFPRANNQALEGATGRHVLFLNPDTEVGEGTLERCVAALDADPELGMVGCRLEYPDGTVQREGARRAYRLRHLLWETFYLHMFFPDHPVFGGQLMGDWDHRGSRDVEALMGAFMMVRAEVAREVGGLPEDFFMYHEDMAFCLRVREAGWRIRYLGDAVTTHHTGRSAARSSDGLDLLEGPVKVALIREGQGRLAAAAARLLYAFRSGLRLALSLVARPLPGLGGPKERYPKVFAPKRHALHLAWAVAPWTVRHRLPEPPPGPNPVSRPTLLLVGPTPPPVHGNAVYTEMLLGSEGLRERYRVVHLDTADRRSLENLGRLDAENVRLALVHVRRLVRLARRHRPDAVYVPVSQNAWAYLRDALFIVVGRLAGARVVTHLHGGYFRTFYREANPLVRWLVRWTTGMLAGAWVLGDGLRHHYEGLLPSERVVAVPNGVPDPFGPADPPDAPDGPFTVLYLGGLARSKGVVELIEALSRLRERVPEARLILAGGWMSPEDERAARKRIRELDLEEAVETPGVVRGAEKRGLLASAHVFAYPTRYPYEGQPLAILEAMAAGLPVVATPRGAIPDCVDDGETGRLVPEGEPEAVARALAELAEEPEIRRRMAREARARYRASFTAAACAERFADALDRALGGRPGATRPTETEA